MLLHEARGWRKRCALVKVHAGLKESERAKRRVQRYTQELGVGSTEGKAHVKAEFGSAQPTHRVELFALMRSRRSAGTGRLWLRTLVGGD